MKYLKIFTQIAVVVLLFKLLFFTEFQSNYSLGEGGGNFYFENENPVSFDTSMYPNWKEANRTQRFFSDRWEEVAIIPNIDTLIFPYWLQADTTYFETYPGDLRYTDTWCEIASRKPIDLGAQIILTNSHHSHNCRGTETK
jgi:hypothetical protein